MLQYIMKLKNKSKVEFFLKSLCPYQAAAAFMSQPNTAPSSLRHMGLGHMLGDPIGSASGSPSSSTPMTTSASNSTSGNRSGGQNHTGGGEGENTDVGRLQEECNTLRGQVQKWEESWAQAKQVRSSSQLPIQQSTLSL